MKRFLATLVVMFLVLCVVGAATAAAAPGNVPGDKPIADAMIGSTGITWVPKVNYARLALTVSRPDGSVFEKTFESGTTPYLDLSGIYGEKSSDGPYTYELRLVPLLDKKIRKDVDFAADKKGELLPRKTLTQTGYFWVQDGAIVTPGALETGPNTSHDGLDRTHDIVHLDDVIIDGSLCVGNDCYSGLAFGFDTIVLMENNLRIFFDDTSSIQSYPRNDWRIICNDSTDGGGNYFAVQDATEVSSIFVLEAGAPDNSLYVDSHGDVGINTSTPYYELHIVDGDSPAVRLEQDGSYGWTPQKWDLCGNESNFFIRDATHASKLPFRIEPEAPTDSIFIKSNGNVGIGTGSPSYTLEVETTGTGAVIAADRTDGATMELSATGNYGIIGTKNTTTVYPVQVKVDGSVIMTVNKTGDYLSMIGGGTYNGTWNPSSSREVKENIDTLTSTEAMVALEGLKPVKYNYKANKEEARVGFIAEEVPELVALNGRKSLGTVDIMAVLTKVVQEQQKTISELKKEIAELKKK